MLYGTYNDIPVKISKSGSDKYCIEPDGVYFENPDAIDTLEKMDFVEYQMHWYKVVLQNDIELIIKSRVDV